MIAVLAAAAAVAFPGTKQEYDMQQQVPVQDVPGEGGEVYTSVNYAYFFFMIFPFMENVISINCFLLNVNLNSSQSHSECLRANRLIKT